MITPSQVRRSALNLIYAVLSGGCAAEDIDSNLFWSISCEKETDRYRTALAKAMVRAGRSSADSARLLATRAEAFTAAAQGDLTTAALREEAAHYMKQSSAFEAALAALAYCLNDKRREGTEQLELCTKDVLTLAKAVSGLAADLILHLEDAAPYRYVTEPLCAALRRRSRLQDEVAAFAAPLALPEHKDIAALQRQARDLAELRPAAVAMVKAVLARREETDAQLETLLAHYTTERLDMVDKAILYIALYELQVSKLEVAIVVSEATALANDYSGSKSAPFIHGIIAAAAKA